MPIKSSRANLVGKIPNKSRPYDINERKILENILNEVLLRINSGPDYNYDNIPKITKINEITEIIIRSNTE